MDGGAWSAEQFKSNNKAPKAGTQPAAKTAEAVPQKAASGAMPRGGSNKGATAKRPKAARAASSAPVGNGARANGAAAGGGGLADAELGRRIRGLLNSDELFRDALQAAAVRELLGDAAAAVSAPRAAAYVGSVAAPRAASNGSAPAAAAPKRAARPAKRANGSGDGKRLRMSPSEVERFDISVEEAIRNVAGDSGARRTDVLKQMGLPLDDASKVSEAAKRLAPAGHIEIDSSRGRPATVWLPR